MAYDILHLKLSSEHAQGQQIVQKTIFWYVQKPDLKCQLSWHIGSLYYTWYSPENGEGGKEEDESWGLVAKSSKNIACDWSASPWELKKIESCKQTLSRNVSIIWQLTFTICYYSPFCLSSIDFLLFAGLVWFCNLFSNLKLILVASMWQ